MPNYDLHDVIEYTLALLPGEKINLSSGRGHVSFHKLKEEYSDFFPDLLFDSNGHIPYSEELEEHFQLMITSGILELTFRPNIYKFDKETKDLLIENLSGKFSEEEKSEINKMSEKLQEILS